MLMELVLPEQNSRWLRVATLVRLEAVTEACVLALNSFQLPLVTQVHLVQSSAT